MTPIYYRPVLWHTGALHAQPDISATQSGWYIDANGQCADTGFLDAPELVPSGSVRGLLCGTSVVVGLQHAGRSAPL